MEPKELSQEHHVSAQSTGTHNDSIMILLLGLSLLTTALDLHAFLHTHTHTHPDMSLCMNAVAHTDLLLTVAGLVQVKCVGFTPAQTGLNTCNRLLFIWSLVNRMHTVWEHRTGRGIMFDNSMSRWDPEELHNQEGRRSMCHNAVTNLWCSEQFKVYCKKGISCEFSSKLIHFFLKNDLQHPQILCECLFVGGKNNLYFLIFIPVLTHIHIWEHTVILKPFSKLQQLVST